MISTIVLVFRYGTKSSTVVTHPVKVTDTTNVPVPVAAYSTLH